MLAINVPNFGKRRARAKSQASKRAAFANRIRDYVTTITGARYIYTYIRRANLFASVRYPSLSDTIVSRLMRNDLCNARTISHSENFRSYGPIAK